MRIQSATIHIGNIIRNAVVFNPKNWQGDTVNADTLPQTVAQLFSLLHQRRIDYLLVGGVALLQYVEGRNTEDIDLIVAAPALSQLPEVQILNQTMYFARGQFQDLHIDFLLTANPLFKKVQQEYATTQHFIESDIQCATVEGLLLLKLYALPSLYREGEFARVGLCENDIAMLLHYYKPDLSVLLDELKPYLSDTDLTELRNIGEEIQQRLARFRPSQKDDQ